jgi:hypothetical protein
MGADSRAWASFAAGASSSSFIHLREPSSIMG